MAWVLDGNIKGPPGPPGATTLDGLTDTDLTGLLDGQVLVFDSASGLWLPQDPPSGGSGDYNLDGGFANSVYRPVDLINGGGASG